MPTPSALVAAAFLSFLTAAQAVDGDALGAAELIGSRTVDLRGEPLGHIEDVLLAKEGETHYAVLSFHRWLGLGERLYTYPLSKLAPGRDGEVVVQVERRKLVGQAGDKLLPLVLRLYDPNALVADPPFVRASELPGGERYLVPRG